LALKVYACIAADQERRKEPSEWDS
jgi:hypothetical protein